MAQMDSAIYFNRFVRFFLGFFFIFIVPNLNSLFRSQNVFGKTPKSGSCPIISFFPTVILNAGLEEMFSNLMVGGTILFSVFAITVVSSFCQFSSLREILKIAFYFLVSRLVRFLFGAQFQEVDAKITAEFKGLRFGVLGLFALTAVIRILYLGSVAVFLYLVGVEYYSFSYLGKFFSWVMTFDFSIVALFAFPEALFEGVGSLGSAEGIGYALFFRPVRPSHSLIVGGTRLGINNSGGPTSLPRLVLKGPIRSWDSNYSMMGSSRSKMTTTVEIHRKLLEVSTKFGNNGGISSTALGEITKLSEGKLNFSNPESAVESSNRLVEYTERGDSVKASSTDLGGATHRKEAVKDSILDTLGVNRSGPNVKVKVESISTGRCTVRTSKRVYELTTPVDEKGKISLEITVPGSKDKPKFESFIREVDKKVIRTEDSVAAALGVVLNKVQPNPEFIKVGGLDLIASPKMVLGNRAAFDPIITEAVGLIVNQSTSLFREVLAVQKVLLSDPGIEALPVDAEFSWKSVALRNQLHGGNTDGGFSGYGDCSFWSRSKSGVIVPSDGLTLIEFKDRYSLESDQIASDEEEAQRVFGCIDPSLRRAPFRDKALRACDVLEPFDHKGFRERYTGAESRQKAYGEFLEQFCRNLKQANIKTVITVVNNSAHPGVLRPKIGGHSILAPEGRPFVFVSENSRDVINNRLRVLKAYAEEDGCKSKGFTYDKVLRSLNEYSIYSQIKDQVFKEYGIVQRTVIMVPIKDRLFSFSIKNIAQW